MHHFAHNKMDDFPSHFLGTSATDINILACATDVRLNSSPSVIYLYRHMLYITYLDKNFMTEYAQFLCANIYIICGHMYYGGMCSKNLIFVEETHILSEMHVLGNGFIHNNKYIQAVNGRCLMHIENCGTDSNITICTTYSHMRAVNWLEQMCLIVCKGMSLFHFSIYVSMFSRRRGMICGIYLLPHFGFVVQKVRTEIG